MATLEDIVAATKILSEDPESEMGGSGSKPKENETKFSSLRKCDGGSDSDAVVSKPVVESEVIVESTFEDDLVKSGSGNNETGEKSLDENGECRSVGDNQSNGIGTDNSVDADGVGEGEGTVEELKDGETGFRVGDFVWGKIKSHPWWPGQVYDPKDASEFALKHKQDGRLLVAFFGDGSCSWCSPSQLIPFVDNFSEMSTDSNSKSFLNAVQRSTDEFGRLMELEMTCNCIPKEKKDSLAKPEATNAAMRAGVVMPELDVCRLPFPRYEPADVFQRVVELAKVVSVGNALDLAVLRSCLSAFYYFNGGHLLPVYHEPFHVEGLEDKNKDVNGVSNDFSVPIEVPIFGPQEDDWLSSPTVGSGNSQAPSETRVLHKRKQRSVAEIMGENKTTKPENRKLASPKEGTDVEKSTTTRKRKKDNDGEVKGAGSEQPSSTGKKGRKRKAEVSESPKEVSNAKDDGADGANGGKVSRKPKEIDVAAAQNTSEAKEESETVTTPRERKKSKYLSPPYTNLAWRLGNSSFKFESPVENDKATKTTQAGEHTEELENAADQPISKSVDNESQEKLSNGQLETPNTSVDTGLRTAKSNKKLSFPVSDVDVSVDELLSEIQHAALDAFYLSKKGSLDTVWGFVSALRSSIYLHGTDYKLYHKRTAGGNQKSLPSQLRDLSNELIEQNAKSPDQNTPRASKKQRKSDTLKSKKTAETSVAKTTTETAEGKTLPFLVLAFTPGFSLPSKKEVVGLFAKFGSLNTKETKVEADSHSIRIVYTNDSDAEAAYKSSLSQCPFGGSENVSYRLQSSPAGRKSRRSHSKVTSPSKRTSEKREASHPADDLVSDFNTIRQKLEITTAIVENYHLKFSSEDKTSLKDEMKQLLEKIETVGDKVRVIAEKSSS